MHASSMDPANDVDVGTQSITAQCWHARTLQVQQGPACE